MSAADPIHFYSRMLSKCSSQWRVNIPGARSDQMCWSRASGTCDQPNEIRVSITVTDSVFPTQTESWPRDCAGLKAWTYKLMLRTLRMSVLIIQHSNVSFPGHAVWFLPCVLHRIQTFDASLCGVSASGDALQRFFTHSLTQTLTFKPRFTGTNKPAS